MDTLEVRLEVVDELQFVFFLSESSLMSKGALKSASMKKMHITFSSNLKL